MTERRSERPPRIPEGNATMQIDAFVDDMEEVALPPQLPPRRKVGAAVWVLGVLVVVLASALGVGLGIFLLGNDAPARRTISAPAPTKAPRPNVVQMDEVVFDVEEAPPARPAR